MKKLFTKLKNKAVGQGSVEYSILIALISVAVISSLVLFAGESVNGECRKIDPESDKLIGNHEYIKNDDTGITSIFKNVTCIIGGWNDEDSDENDEGNNGEVVNPEAGVLTLDEAREAGFDIDIKKPLFSSDYYQINGFDENKLLEDKKVVIPKMIIDENGRTHKVKSIGSFAFNNKGIETVVIPETVESIRMGAFTNNPNLEEVIIKGDNTYAYIGAFPSEMNLRRKLKPGIYTRKQ